MHTLNRLVMQRVVTSISRVPRVPAVLHLRNPASFAPLRAMSATTRRDDPFKPAARVAGQKQDVWCVNYINAL